VSYDNKSNFKVAKPQDTQDTQDNLKSRFDPPCIKKARESPTLDALRVLLSWYKRLGLNESKRLQIAKTFFTVHNLKIPKNIFDLLDTPSFTCEFAKDLGFCDEENCREKLPPADRLIMDTDSVLLFHSTGELDIKIAGRRKIIPLKRIFKRDKSGSRINTAIFDEIFLECYYIPPNPPFDEDSALKVYQEWLDRAELIKEAIDPETSLEETVIRILTTKRSFYDLKLLKEGLIPPKRGFFIDGDVIYVESELFRELLEEEGIKERKERVAKAIRRLLAGPSRQIRFGKDKKDRRYFWRFNLKAIQSILKREGEDWVPEVKTEDDLAKALKSINQKDENTQDSSDDSLGGDWSIDDILGGDPPG